MVRPGSPPREVVVGDVGSYRRNVTGPLLWSSSAEETGLGLRWGAVGRRRCGETRRLWKMSRGRERSHWKPGEPEKSVPQGKAGEKKGICSCKLKID